MSTGLAVKIFAQQPPNGVFQGDRTVARKFSIRGVWVCAGGTWHSKNSTDLWCFNFGRFSPPWQRDWADQAGSFTSVKPCKKCDSGRVELLWSVTRFKMFWKNVAQIEKFHRKTRLASDQVTGKSRFIESLASLALMPGVLF